MSTPTQWERMGTPTKCDMSCDTLWKSLVAYSASYSKPEWEIMFVNMPGPAESGSRGSFEVRVGAVEEGEVVCLVSKYEFWLQDVRFLRHVVNSEASKVENTTTKMLRGLDQLIKRKEDGGSWRVMEDYPQTDRQSERIIQPLEDIYAPFEALYGRKCRSSVLWDEIRESRLIIVELVQETTDKVVLIKEKLKAARERQKSYADNRRKLLEFKVEDQVLLKISPWKGVVRLERKTC
nr:putative reverse transcriptase domain-containing protein [Tanacetum cinerariifolium]